MCERKWEAMDSAGDDELAVFSGSGFIGLIDLFDVAAHAVKNRIDKSADFLARTFGDKLNSSIGEVAHKPGDIKIDRDIAGSISKADTLHATLEIAMATATFCDNRRHTAVYTGWISCDQIKFYFHDRLFVLERPFAWRIENQGAVFEVDYSANCRTIR
jgi:hypothetical protein